MTPAEAKALGLKKDEGFWIDPDYPEEEINISKITAENYLKRVQNTWYEKGYWACQNDIKKVLDIK